MQVAGAHVNAIHSRTGMQYINTSRGGEGGGNNAELARDNTGVVRLKRRL